MSKLLSLNKRFKSRLSGVFPTLLSLDNSKELFTVLHSFAWKVISITTGKTRVSPRLRRFNKFLLLITKMYRFHGSLFVIKYLKACHMAIQKKLSSQPFRSLREIEPDYPFPRLINGLPNFIGTMDRSAIRAGHPGTIRLWLSILNVYRVLKGPYVLKLSTITDKWKGNQDEILSLTSVFKDLIKFNKLNRPIKELKVEEIHRSLASGPNCRVAISAILTDAIAIAKYPEIYDPFRQYCLMTNSFKFLGYLDNAIEWYYTILTKYENFSVKVACSVKQFDDIALGKLAFKEEAAGKLRVFAIVDIWTQSLFKPLHNSLFRLLEGLPNDGTFDQDASFARALEKAVLYNCAYSVDLSSATDRLPIDLQVRIIDIIYGSALGKLWKEILVLRPYFVRKDSYGITANSYYHYGTGQPMGCLSSWAMLAITHHCIVQACAFRVYGTLRWFEKYEILGDDLVIFDKLIYDEYIRVMKELDVGVNPSKSLISDSLNSFEFAKRTGLNGLDVSGISWKQLIAENSLTGRTSFALTMLKKGFITNPSILVKALMSSQFTHFDKVSKDNVLYSLVSNACFGILGSFVNLDKISLSSVVALLVDPRLEADELDSENLKSPLTSVLRTIFQVLNAKPGEKVIPSISHFEKREEMVKHEILNFMADDMMREAYSKILIFIQEYDSKLAQYAESLVTKASYERLNKVEQAQLVSFAELTLLKERDPQDLANEIESILLAERELVPMETAKKFSRKVEAFISSFDIDPVKRTGKTSELPRLIVDVSSTGQLKSTPYWRTLESVRP